MRSREPLEKVGNSKNRPISFEVTSNLLRSLLNFAIFRSVFETLEIGVSSKIETLENDLWTGV
jgi:hypothetical protein